MEVTKDDGSIIYVGYIYRHWIINEDGIEVSYIGKTEYEPSKRFGVGGKKYLGKDTKFERAIKKYGWDNFNHDTIYTAECETYDELHSTLIELEKYFIAKYDSYHNGYNSTPGGEGVQKGTKPWNYGKHGVYTEDTLYKMSENRKGKCVGEGNPFYGKKHTNESRKKMSDSQKRLYDEGYVNPSKGLRRSEEAKRKMSISQKERLKDPTNNPMYGKHHSEETRQKLSESRKGKYTGEDNPFYGKHHSEESKQKMREANIGKHPTEETRAKLSESSKGAKNPKARAVICLNNKQVFSTAKEAKEWCGGNVTHCCLNRIRSAGKHPETGEKLHWMFYDEYLKLKEEEDDINGK